VTVRSMTSTRQWTRAFSCNRTFLLQTRLNRIKSNRKVVARVTCPSFVSTPRIF
jgi:hypothetical protein